jgi:hypothetical protein
MSQPTQITIRGGSPDVLARIGEVASAGGANVVVVKPRGEPCAICQAVTVPHQLKAVRGIDGEICPLCHEAAVRLDDRFREGAKKGYAEFRSQLPQMIRDLRNGCEEPTFYRGIEG